MCGVGMGVESAVIDDLIRRIVTAASPLRVILFGSAARRESLPDSDIDVLVVVPNGTNRCQAAQSVYKQIIGFGRPVDVIVATEEDLEKYGADYSMVFFPTLREGREILLPEPPVPGSLQGQNTPICGRFCPKSDQISAE